MKRKLSGLVLTGSSALLISTMLFGSQAFANTLNDLKEEQKEIEQKKTELNSKIKEKNTEIKLNQTKQDKLLDQILALNKEIVTTENSIDKTKGHINQTKTEIDKLQSGIKELEEKIENRENLLQERLRAIQAGGEISFIDVLLGSDSFIDFIDRFSAVNTLMEADRNIIKEQANDKMALEEKKVQVEEKLVNLENSYNELTALKNSLDSQKDEKSTLINQLEAEQEKLKKSKKNLQANYAEVYQLSEELTADIRAEQERLARIAREQERKRKQSSTNNSGSANLPVTSSGTWTTPTYGTFTSSYGYRTFDNSNHLGVDVANSPGTPIVAAADGIVSYAAPLAGFGNLVMITHSINGQTFITLYAHTSSYNVSVGQEVSKGDQIAKMGNTGNSTGPHLHFEVHVGSWDWRGSTSVNPLFFN